MTGLAVSNNTVTIHFTGSAFGDSAAHYSLLSANQIAGPFLSVTGANITPAGTNLFNQYVAEAPAQTNTTYYRIVWKF